METLLPGISLILQLWLIVGLIKPSAATWFDHPTRLKVFGTWILGMFVMVIVSLVTNQDVPQPASSSIEVPKVNDEIFLEPDSAEIARKRKNISKYIQRSIKEEKERDLIKYSEEVEKVKKQLIREIEGEFWKTASDRNYNGDLKSMQVELITFGALKLLIDDARQHSDKEIQRLAKELKAKVVKYQIKKLPILRSEYAKIAKRIYWERDIDVRLGGQKNTTLEFIGIHFSANKNIQFTQDALYNQLMMFRFKRINYRWSKWDDEYTYYDMKTLDDSELYQSDELQFE